MNNKQKQSAGFTLIELLIVIMIIGILAGTAVFVLLGAQEDARKQRAKTQIQRIHNVLMQHWEDLESRHINLVASNSAGQTTSNGPINTDQNGLNNLSPYQRAGARLMGMRELMRLEMPDRLADINTAPQDLRVPDHQLDAGGDRYNQGIVFTIEQPSVWKSYSAQLSAVAASTSHESAECLYMILGSIEDEIGSPLDHFSESEIGDVDGDGLKEILDPWGNPIYFIRWPAGFRSSIQPVVIQDFVLNGATEYDPDSFDPFKRDERFDKNYYPDGDPVVRPFMLVPLVYSAGPDEVYDLDVRADVVNGAGRPNSDVPPLRTATNNDYGLLPDPYFYDQTGAQPFLGTWFAIRYQW